MQPTVRTYESVLVRYHTKRKHACKLCVWGGGGICQTKTRCPRATTKTKGSRVRGRNSDGERRTRGNGETENEGSVATPTPSPAASSWRHWRNVRWHRLPEAAERRAAKCLLEPLERLVCQILQRLERVELRWVVDSRSLQQVLRAAFEQLVDVHLRQLGVAVLGGFHLLDRLDAGVPHRQAVIFFGVREQHAVTAALVVAVRQSAEVVVSRFGDVLQRRQPKSATKHTHTLTETSILLTLRQM